MTKRLHLEAAARYLAESGDKSLENSPILEFGVFLGDSILELLSLFQVYNLRPNKIIGIDSFSGLPENEHSFSKFSGGAYNARASVDNPIEFIHNKVRYPDLFLIESWYDQLNYQDVVLNEI